MLTYCRADKYTCTQLDRLARDYLRRNFETVVKCNGRPPNRVGLVNLSQTALMHILTDDNLELSSEVNIHMVHSLTISGLGLGPSICLLVLFMIDNTFAVVELGCAGQFLSY